jgi:ketosteroid isomerase-like protein
MRTFNLVRIVLALTAVCGLATLPAYAKDAEKDVLAAMDTWKQATMKKDKALFEKVYHPELSYGHSSGLVETKAQAIEHVVGSKVQYEGIDFTDSKVRVLGNTALLTGKLEMRQRSAADQVNVVNLVYLTVWTKGPRGWQMLGRQATRPTPPGSPTAATPTTPGTAQTAPAAKP